MKVWITKHALTSGIREIEAEQSNACPSMVLDRSGSYSQYFHGEGRDWHRTLEGAKARAEEMRGKRIASLKKSIAKLEKLRF